MAKLTFITPAKEEITVEADSGSVMEVAVGASVSGIDGDCGGGCSCCTCHVHVPAEWMVKVGNPDPIESSMLEFESSANEYSRLSCQIPVSEELDGIVLNVVGR